MRSHGQPCLRVALAAPWRATPLCHAQDHADALDANVRTTLLAQGARDDAAQLLGYVANNGAANVLYENPVGVVSITLVVKPLTTAGAPSVFGSVMLETSGNELVALRTLDGGSSYCSQNG